MSPPVPAVCRNIAPVSYPKAVQSGRREEDALQTEPSGMRPGLKVKRVQDAEVVPVRRDPSSPSPRLCSRSSPGAGSATAQLSAAARGRDDVEPDPAGFMELPRPARASCADRKRGENRSFIALSLFPSSERSHQKIQPDKAHRPALDDFTAVSKAERAPERSLVQPPAYDKKRLRDCSSERSEGRLPRPGLSGGAWALLHTQPLSPFGLGEGGNALLLGLVTTAATPRVL